MFQPLDIPPGLNADDTTLAAFPAWADASLVRFRNGRAETMPGWESITLTLLTGVCRAALGWTDNSNLQNLAFGTHSKLQVWVNGSTLADITPFGPVDVLGADPITTSNGSATVTVAHTAHGLASTNQIIMSGAVDTGGIVAANLNGTRTVTVTDADHYTFVAGASASSGAIGGGAAIRVIPQVALPAGPVDGAPSAGYGTGSYGGGAYGSTVSSTSYYPRTWALAAWGQKLLANPRGGAIYEWSNDTSVKAVAVANCPPAVNHMIVTPQFQVMALGCTQENGLYGPKCIRHSSVRDETTWATATTDITTAREYTLPYGGYLVAGAAIGKNVLIWSNHELWLGTYVGQIAQVWRFDLVGKNCGLIGPNAFAIMGSAAYWISPDRQFHAYALGGVVQPIDCPIRTDFAENLAASQGDKICASTIAEHNEVTWFYPDSRDGFENSRYITLGALGSDAGHWARGQLARTAFVDAGPSRYPVGVTYAGNIYWHEKGDTADGGALEWFIETADLYFDLNQVTAVTECWPDISGQVGAVSLTIYSRLYPQGDVTTAGPYTLTSSQDRVGIRAKGRLHRVRWSGASAPSAARIGRPAFKTVGVGSR